METTYEIPEGLKKENWKQDHLVFKHDGFYFAWCPLCMAKQEGERNDVKNNDLEIDVSDDINMVDKFG